MAQTFSITEKTDGKKLCDALVKQIIELEGELTALETEIAKEEQNINQLIYPFFG